mgnify:CR=1 FL=1
MFREPEPTENQDFQDFQDFHILECLMTNSCPPEKWSLKCFNLNETLHVHRLSISPAAYSRLLGNEFRDFEIPEKHGQISSKVGVWSAAVLPWWSIYLVQNPDIIRRQKKNKK